MMKRNSDDRLGLMGRLASSFRAARGKSGAFVVALIICVLAPALARAACPATVDFSGTPVGGTVTLDLGRITNTGAITNPKIGRAHV